MLATPFYLALRRTPDNRGLGVYAKLHVPAGTALGLYTGRVLFDEPADETNAYVVRVERDDGSTRYFVDARPLEPLAADAPPVSIGDDVAPLARDEQQASWTRYINSIDPGDGERQNVEFVVGADARVHVVASRSIAPNAELLTDYGASFFLVDVDALVFEQVGDESAREESMFALVGDSPAAYTSVLEYARSRDVLRVARERAGGRRVGFSLVSYASAVPHVRELFALDVKNRARLRAALFADVEDEAAARGATLVHASTHVFVSPAEARARRYVAMLDADGRSLEHAQLALGPLDVVEATRAHRDVLLRRADVACPELRKLDASAFARDELTLYFGVTADAEVATVLVVDRLGVAQLLCTLDTMSERRRPALLRETLDFYRRLGSPARVFAFTQLHVALLRAASFRLAPARERRRYLSLIGADARLFTDEVRG